MTTKCTNCKKEFPEEDLTETTVTATYNNGNKKDMQIFLCDSCADHLIEVSQKNNIPD